MELSKILNLAFHSLKLTTATIVSQRYWVEEWKLLEPNGSFQIHWVESSGKTNVGNGKIDGFHFDVYYLILQKIEVLCDQILKKMILCDNTSPFAMFVYPFRVIWLTCFPKNEALEPFRTARRSTSRCWMGGCFYSWKDSKTQVLEICRLLWSSLKKSKVETKHKMWEMRIWMFVPSSWKQLRFWLLFLLKEHWKQPVIRVRSVWAETGIRKLVLKLPKSWILLDKS